MDIGAIELHDIGMFEMCEKSDVLKFAHEGLNIFVCALFELLPYHLSVN